MLGPHPIDAAFEIAIGEGTAPIVLTCEHASNCIPAPWAWPEADRWLQPTHWAFDLGIAEITRQLAAELDAPAILARFSRLLVDANRPLDAETLFRTQADGRPVTLNLSADAEERARRIRSFYDPYHEALDSLLEARPPGLVLAMHSFTPVYEGGTWRPMEMGVLFDTHESEAMRLGLAFQETGLITAMNAPYSGADGLMWSAQSHADRFGWTALELEIRQDLSADPAQRNRLVKAILHALEVAELL